MGTSRKSLKVNIEVFGKASSYSGIVIYVTSVDSLQIEKEYFMGYLQDKI